MKLRNVETVQESTI